VTVPRDRLVAYLDEYLEAARGSDYGPNGLQVEGAAEIGKLATGVSACHELFARAAAGGAQAVLVHHGIFWRFTSPLLVGHQRRRVAELLRHDLNLLAYHLPLDRHPEVGNNALACRRLGLEGLVPFAEHEGLPIGFRGAFPAPLPVAELVGRCRELFGQEPLLLGGGDHPVRTLGVVSGGAQSELLQAVAAGLDAYLTGEASEWVTNVAREAGIHYLACGHYATERLGIQALGDHLRRHFDLEVEFIDVPNPV
jgi:dinuclear metal center YbgI/SA1388 family protein